MKLKEKIYARTFDGVIKYTNKIYKDGDKEYKPTKLVKKASKNIIDLIEVGDYVNGMKVEKIETPKIKAMENVWLLTSTDSFYEQARIINVEPIKEILTKEQYEANVYRLGGDK